MFHCTKKKTTKKWTKIYFFCRLLKLCNWDDTNDASHHTAPDWPHQASKAFLFSWWRPTDGRTRVRDIYYIFGGNRFFICSNPLQPPSMKWNRARKYIYEGCASRNLIGKQHTQLSNSTSSKGGIWLRFHVSHTDTISIHHPNLPARHLLEYSRL